MNEELRQELLMMAREDQAMRRRLTNHGGLADPDIDRRNTERLKQIVDTYGFPGRSLVGQDGADAAWLIVQHSPDRDFQRRCLALIQKQVECGEASPRAYAYLLDRVRVFAGEPQVYGTQFRHQRGEHHVSCFPIEDSANVDERRRQVGLEPLSESMLRGGSWVYAQGTLRLENPKMTWADAGPNRAHVRAVSGQSATEFDAEWNPAAAVCRFTSLRWETGTGPSA